MAKINGPRADNSLVWQDYPKDWWQSTWHLLLVICYIYIFQELRTFSCRGCNLRNMNPHMYSLLSNLAHLDLGDNQFKYLDREEFRDLRKLLSLKLDGNHFPVVLEGTFQSQVKVAPITFKYHPFIILIDSSCLIRPLQSISFKVYHCSILSASFIHIICSSFSCGNTQVENWISSINFWLQSSTSHFYFLVYFLPLLPLLSRLLRSQLRMQDRVGTLRNPLPNFPLCTRWTGRTLILFLQSPEQNTFSYE